MECRLHAFYLTTLSVIWAASNPSSNYRVVNEAESSRIQCKTAVLKLEEKELLQILALYT